MDTHDNSLLLSYFFRFDKSSTDIKLLVSMLVILDFVKTYVVCFQKIIFFMNTLYDFFSILIFTLKTQYENTC